MMLAMMLVGAALAAPTHEVTLSAGASPLFVTDLFVGPLRQSGVLPEVTLGWSPRTETLAQVVELDLVTGGIRPGPDWSYLRDGETLQANHSTVTALDLRYALGRTLDRGALQVSLGGTLHNHFEQDDWYIAFIAPSMYLGIFSVAPWAEARLDLGARDRLAVEGWVPVASWVARPAWAGTSFDQIHANREHAPLRTIARYIGDGAPHTVDQHQGAHLRASWAHAVSGRWSTVVGGRFDLTHLTEPRPTTHTQLGVTVGMRGSF